MNVNQNYLNRFFTKKFIVDLIYSDDFMPESFIQELERNYNLLNLEYRNEYFYKNILFNKLILGKYSLNTSTALSEVIIENSKADFIVINHSTGIVYEIKTDLDNLDRLIYQLNDYYKAFGIVNVVTSEKNYYPIYKLVKESNPNVGIIVLTKNKSLSVRKEATLNYNDLSYETLFKLLRKNEYEKIIKSHFHIVPNVKQVYLFRSYFELFKRIPILNAQKLVFSELNKRYKSREVRIIKKFPESIRWLIYSGRYNEQTLLFLYNRLFPKGGSNVFSNN